MLLEGQYRIFSYRHEIPIANTLEQLVQYFLYSLITHCSAVFSSNRLLVVVAELQGEEREALDIVPVITTALLEEQQLG